MKLLGEYRNGNYTVKLFDDGTKIRETEEEDFIPNFSECCDVKFTHKCSQGCPFCYEDCKPSGKHSNILEQPWIHTLHPWTELAINGNDLDHPDLERFLRIMKLQKVIVNITVNQNQFFDNLSYITKLSEEEKIKGIGVSLKSWTPELEEAIQGLDNIVIHTINGILSQEDLDEMVNKNLKILILGYKDVRRGHDYLNSEAAENIRRNQEYLYNNLKTLIPKFKAVSFDNLSLKQLNVKRLLTPADWEEFYMGDDGQFTFYIDAVQERFAKNSVIYESESYPIEGRTIDEMFKFIKEKYGKTI